MAKTAMLDAKVDLMQTDLCHLVFRWRAYPELRKQSPSDRVSRWVGDVLMYLY